jgi:hypothetical protein
MASGKQHPVPSACERCADPERRYSEITLTYLGKNTFHFQDARCCGMREFLKTPFHCGYRPRDYVRDIVIFIRCDGPVCSNDRHIWDEHKEDYDNQFPGREFPFLENGLYTDIRHNIDFIQKLVFAKKPAITLVFLIPFVPRHRKSYPSIDIPRI